MSLTLTTTRIDWELDTHTYTAKWVAIRVVMKWYTWTKYYKTFKMMNYLELE